MSTLLPPEFSFLEKQTQIIARTIINPREKELFIRDTIEMCRATQQPITSSRLVYPTIKSEKKIGHGKV
jgi:hypothetical protein